MRVLKFGGTSVGDPGCARTVVDLVTRRSHEGLVVVLSATSGTTDRLAAIGEAAAAGRLRHALAGVATLRESHRRLLDELVPAGGRREAVAARCRSLLDRVEAMARGAAALGDLSATAAARLIAHGERLSTRILTAALAAEGLPVHEVDAAGIVVAEGDPLAGEAVLEATRERARSQLEPLLEAGSIVLTQGFVASSPAGTPMTLGRGGSDWTATLLGACLGAEEVEIWTDVDGIMTADPSLVPAARPIPAMSFAEAAELAAFGARVLHPRTLLPAIERGIPVRVLNTRRPGMAGTVVLADVPPDPRPVRSIAYKEGLTMVQLVSARMFKAHGFLRRVFAVLDRHRLAPDIAATSEVSVAMGFADAGRLPAALAELAELGRVDVRPCQAVVCVVGDRLKGVPGIVAQVFADLGDVPASLVSFGGSEIALGLVVDEAHLAGVVHRLHLRFFETPTALPVAASA